MNEDLDFFLIFVINMNKTTSSNYGDATYWLKPKGKVFYSFFFFNYVGSFAFLFIIITYTKIKECLVNKI